MLPKWQENVILDFGYFVIIIRLFSDQKSFEMSETSYSWKS